jgi:hypothetical protein
MDSWEEERNRKVKIMDEQRSAIQEFLQLVGSTTNVPYECGHYRYGHAEVI